MPPHPPRAPPGTHVSMNTLFPPFAQSHCCRSQPAGLIDVLLHVQTSRTDLPAVPVVCTARAPCYGETQQIGYALPRSGAATNPGFPRSPASEVVASIYPGRLNHGMDVSRWGQCCQTTRGTDRPWPWHPRHRFCSRVQIRRRGTRPTDRGSAWCRYPSVARRVLAGTAGNRHSPTRVSLEPHPTRRFHGQGWPTARRPHACRCALRGHRSTSSFSAVMSLTTPFTCTVTSRGFSDATR